MTCKGFVFGGGRSFGSNSMLKLPVYLRGHTCYFHTRISGVQFKRSLGTSDPLTVGFRRSLTRDWRLMRLHGLGIKPRRRFVRTTDNSDRDSPIFPNLYRNVIPSRPDLVWVADFAYIRLETGFCYLAAILDACKVAGRLRSKRSKPKQALTN